MEPRREKLIKNWDEDPQEYEIFVYFSPPYLIHMPELGALLKRSLMECAFFAQKLIAGNELINYLFSKHSRTAERNPHTVRDSGTAL